MMNEFFNYCSQALKAGHRPLSSIITNPRWTLTRPRLLKELREQNFNCVISRHVSVSLAASDELLKVLDDCEVRFAPWTSFRFDENVYFAFVRTKDCAAFELLWPLT